VFSVKFSSTSALPILAKTELDASTMSTTSLVIVLPDSQEVCAKPISMTVPERLVNTALLALMMSTAFLVFVPLVTLATFVRTKSMSAPPALVRMAPVVQIL
jgi:hypothetical protein